MSCMAFVDVVLLDRERQTMTYMQDVPHDVAMFDFKQFDRVAWGYRCASDTMYLCAHLLSAAHPFTNGWQQ
eukprot:COSAG05_NODE_2017_length_3688_cov_1.674283_2_plen_71_part_00